MDVLYFFQRRTKFIRDFYDNTAPTFEEIKRKVEKYESPYELPPDYDDTEPPYLEEWQEADGAVEFLGQSCLSYLAASLKLFLDESRGETERSFGDVPGFPKFDAKLAKSEGAIAANHAWFETLGIDLNDSGVAPALLEEVLLTRNRVQHPESIGFSWLKQSASDYKKFPQPFFASEAEIEMSTDDDGSLHHDFPWLLSVHRTPLFNALDECDKFATWLEHERLNIGRQKD